MKNIININVISIITTAVLCSGATLHAAPNSCLSGATYDATLMKCVSAAVVPCPIAGYVFSDASGRCEMAPKCASGSYDNGTDKCLSNLLIGDATGGYSCKNGTLSGTLCSVAGAAVLTGAVNYNRPIANLSFYPPNAGVATYGNTLGWCSESWFAGSVPVYPSGSYEYVWEDNAQSMPILCYLSQTQGNGTTIPLYSVRGASAAAEEGFSTGWFNMWGSLICVAGEPKANTYTWPVFSSTTDIGCGTIGYLAPASGLRGGTQTCASGGTVSGTDCLYPADYGYQCEPAQAPAIATVVGSTCRALTFTPASCYGGQHDLDENVCYDAALETTCNNATEVLLGGQCVSPLRCTKGNSTLIWPSPDFVDINTLSTFRSRIDEKREDAGLAPFSWSASTDLNSTSVLEIKMALLQIFQKCESAIIPEIVSAINIESDINIEFLDAIQKAINQAD